VLSNFRFHKYFIICFESVNADNGFTAPSECANTSKLCVPTTLQLSCDTTTQLGVHDALSPTQMPPKKRHRRSASVPGGTRSESRIQKYFQRHRQSSGLHQPVPIHADVAGIIRTPVVTSQPIVSPASDDAGQNTTAVSRPTFRFSGSRSSHDGASFSDFQLSSFEGVWVPMPIRPLSECKVEPAGNPSLSSPTHTEVVRNKPDTASVQHGQPVTRCHSQPGALLTRTLNLKRRRDEYRPWLDFRKMREVITLCCCP